MRALMRNVTRAVGAAAAVIGALWCGAAAGQSTAWSGELSGWTLHAAYSTAQQRVVGMLAVSDGSDLVGDNFSVVWFARGEDGAWSSNGWQGAEAGSAISYVRAVTGEPGLFGEIPEFAGLAGEGLPTALAAGLAEGDPMAEAVAEAEDPAAVTEFLAGVGYAAAPLLSGLMATDASGPGGGGGGAVGAAAVLTAMASQAEGAIEGEEEGTIAIGLCWCSKKTTTTYSAWTNTYSRPNTAGRLCIYTATRTVTVSYTGSKFLSCGSCPAATSTTSTVYGYIQLSDESQSCPTYAGGPPGATNPPNIVEEDPTPQA